jgi:hypothetical protein
VYGGSPLVLTDAVRHLNQPFAPSSHHDFGNWGFAASNAPLPALYQELLDTSKKSEKREQAYDLLAWALENIDMSREDKKEIKDALHNYRSAAGPGRTRR